MTQYDDPIAAIATAPGRGGIGVVRVSGKSLLPLVQALLGATPAPRRALRTAFFDAHGAAIDDGIALYFPAPRSYTGEDLLELQGHGGPVVMQMLLKRCLELGARLAGPGEFTRRAFLNDKLDLAQAESVADLIEAATDSAARCALRSLRGEFSAAIEELVRQLIELRMLVEATLDFPEEELDPLDRADVKGRHARLTGAIETALKKSRQGSLLRTGLQVVLAGRPNVGKSSLLNRLAGEELAIVTAIPGTTRDSVRQAIHIDGVPLNIVDTAGLRDAQDEVERMGIARTWSEIGKADVVLLLVDARAGVTKRDLELVERVPQGAKRVFVHNKIDLAGNAPRVQRGETSTSLHLSAKTGAGMDLLRAELLAVAGWQQGAEDLFMARERHLVALRQAAQHATRAGEHFGRPELFAEELRLAQEQLNSITGEFAADDLLGEIFSRFCIGK
ncbi:MAG: tRNA uridine-5-carboxymethylaminomethyl(34) synthesis GTPase MnmE [Betaproteobacteria bacterium]|nr:tRNA uridine-5-carboxymethylaminomethyl(34) synthesis GTPase MnmE [Betaproteobacteria bacterium]OGA35013.1 MAG: tRNA uridine-5-carboxymethylaminomethyl(34) synthesis GTPase MnmE [Betaproteobacteria bacterium RIFCSPLOWO2_12_FULL_64_23]